MLFPDGILISNFCLSDGRLTRWEDNSDAVFRWEVKDGLNGGWSAIRPKSKASRIGE